MNLLGCDSLVGLLVLCLSLIIKAENGSKPKAKRYPDKPFPKHNLILGRNVTCGDIPEHMIGKFVSHTWTCRDIRVNNNRIAYGLYPGMGVDSKCNETGGKHEFSQLCRELLKKMAIDTPLHALYISDASCDYTSEMRALLNKTSDKVFEWIDHPPGNGWINTIQCMIVLDGSL